LTIPKEQVLPEQDEPLDGATMLQMTFTEAEQQALHYERFHHPHPRVQQKMEALLLKSHGLPHGTIARILRIEEGTLRDYLRAYQAGGIEQLKIIPWQGTTSELASHQGTLKDFFCSILRRR
jgi:hypothetical protein